VANEAATRLGEVEGLHQMRVGLRRLRAAITVFSSITADGERERIKGELRWFSGVLGAARDLDVLIADVLVPMRDEHPDKPAFARICREFESRRARAYEAVTAAVDSDRYRALLLDTMEWIESGPWRTNADPLLQVRREQPITTLAIDQLSRRYRKIVKLGKDLRKSSPEERHLLRIRGKKLRYATEFLGELFPGKRNSRRCNEALSALKNLQDSLGGLNDIVTRESIAVQIADEGSAADPANRARTFAAGIIVGAQESRRAQLLDAAERAYDDLAAVKPFWD
jgi:CHAD domain-containing protein